MGLVGGLEEHWKKRGRRSRNWAKGFTLKVGKILLFACLNKHTF